MYPNNIYSIHCMFQPVKPAVSGAEGEPAQVPAFLPVLPSQAQGARPG